MEWRDSLRANLSLWPNLTPNLAAISTCAGKPWDEAAFLEAIKAETARQASLAPTGIGSTLAGDEEGSSDEPGDNQPPGAAQQAAAKVAGTNRTVRQTIEIMVLGGLAYRDEAKVLHLTAVGKELLRFLRPNELGKRIANPQNIHLAGRLMLPGLMAIAEYRAVLLLSAQADGRLSTEELNRSIRAMSAWPTPDRALVDRLAGSIIEARSAGDVRAIGARWYRDEDYGTAKEGDQRKAVNPWFLLAGGGGLVIETIQQAERRIHPLLVAEVRKMADLTAVSLQLPTKNILETSESFALGFSKLCM
jgi:hypothetical protein